MEESSQPPQTSNSAFNLRAFGKDILIYTAGQGLVLLFGAVQVFIIPKYLSVEGYGYWQTFVLYASYVGILHFGFNDGILLRWAGKELSQIGGEIKTAFRFLLLEQLIVIIPLALLFYFLLQPPFQWIGLMILAYAFIVNLATFFTFTTQAVRKFKLLTMTNVGRGGVFLLFIIPLFISGTRDYLDITIAFSISWLLILLTFAFWFRKYLWSKRPAISSLWAYGKQNIGIGVFVLLGNFVVVLFMTIDRLMVSSFFPIEQFAIYAFALMIAMVAYTFVGAISQVFFPNLSAMATELRTKAYHLGKPAIILAWAAILAVYFPATRLVEFYLPRYVASLPILQILLCTVGFGSVIQVLHVNYYKAYRKQRQYFIWGITALALSVILNLLAIKVFGTLESVTVATLISFGIWYIVNEVTLKSVVEESSRQIWKGLLLICCYLGAFWFASFLADWFVTRMLIYIGFFSIITWFLLRSDIREMMTKVRRLRDSHL